MNRFIYLILVSYLLFFANVNANCLLSKVNTSFLQLNSEQSNLVLDAWDSWFEQAHKMGINHLIIQWSSYDDLLFYPKANFQSKPLLYQIIKAAEKAQISITMGLHSDSKFWSAIEGNDAQLQNYLEDRLKKQQQLMPDLLNNINAADPNGKTVIGWYIADEIDDKNWQGEARRLLLKKYLNEMILLLKKSKNNWPISISTYSTGKASDQQVVELYRFLFSILDINKILFQDSIGTGHLTLDTLEHYLKLIDVQFPSYKNRFGIIVELFVPSDHSSSRESAPASKVIKQLELARQYSDTETVLFSFFSYILPENSAGKRSELYNVWQEQRGAC